MGAEKGIHHVILELKGALDYRIDIILQTGKLGSRERTLFPCGHIVN